MYLPKQASIVEVGLRDGLQGMPTFVPTEKKISLARKLMNTGLKAVEITSFVNPKAVPQMADAKELVAAVRAEAHKCGVETTALVLNRRGALEAISSGVDALTFVISVSETHNKNNANKSPRESLKEFMELMPAAKGHIKVKLALATAFGCPFEGETKSDLLLEMVREGLAAGADEITLADTIGSANPVHLECLLLDLARIMPLEKLCLHFHDTRGMALANILTALQVGVVKFEAAIGGLGGCPFAPGATGNVATEDVLGLFHSIGVETGIDATQLREAVEWVREEVDANLSSHMSRLKLCDNLQIKSN